MSDNPFESLMATMSALRGINGCPWDREQSLETLKSYLIEEAYEVIDAIDGGQPQEHLEELGDLLFQIVFQSQIRAETNDFTLLDVARVIDEKMQRRHPHVFGNTKAETSDAVARNWDQLKQEERVQKQDHSRFSGVPIHLPALLRAQRLGEKASRLGLDWHDAHDVIPKIREELHEFEDALQYASTHEQETEFGDLLFTLVNLARHLGIDAENALALANKKFERRARFVEAGLSAKNPPDAEEVEALWVDAKTRTGSSS